MGGHPADLHRQQEIDDVALAPFTLDSRVAVLDRRIHVAAVHLDGLGVTAIHELIQIAIHDLAGYPARYSHVHGKTARRDRIDRDAYRAIPGIARLLTDGESTEAGRTAGEQVHINVAVVLRIDVTAEGRNQAHDIGRTARRVDPGEPFVIAKGTERILIEEAV